MPREVIIKKESKRLLIAVGIVVGITLGVGILMDLGIFAAIKFKEASTQNLNNMINNLSGTEQKVNLINAVKAKIDYRENIIKKLYDSRINTVELMNKIEGILPKDVSINKLDINNDGKVSINGSADNEKSILGFYHDLKVQGIGNSIEFNTIAGIIGDPEGLEFNITFKLNGRK